LAPLTDDDIPPHTLTLPVNLSGTAEIRPPGGTGRLQDIVGNHKNIEKENADLSHITR